MTNPITQIIISFIITIIVYLFFPLLLILSKSEMSKKSIKRTVILNGIFCFILFSFLRNIMGIESSTNIAPACIWSSIAYLLLMKKCYTSPDTTHIDMPVPKQQFDEPIKNDYNIMDNRISSNSTSISTDNTEPSLNSSIVDDTEKCGKAYKQPTTEKEKKKYCSKCGALIDFTTKKCTGCGKQYFKGIPSIIYILIILLLLVCLCIMTFSSNSQRSQLQYYKDNYESYKTKYETSQEQINSLREEVQINTNKLQFIDNYVVFIEDDGTNLYHIYECEEFVGEEFYVLNTEWAVAEGYKPCSKCH